MNARGGLITQITRGDHMPCPSYRFGFPDYYTFNHNGRTENDYEQEIDD